MPHAFSTRLGGISPPPFDSMNLGNPSGCETQDPYDHIWENYHRLQTAIGCRERRLCRVHQVHGAGVIGVERSGNLDPSTKADAMVTADASAMLSVRVADCVPILLATADGGAVAAVHAGWRGVVGGVVNEAIIALTRLRPDASKKLLAAIGPCIGEEAFEVGDEVLDEFAGLFGPAAPIRRRSDGKGHVNLREAVRRQLLNAGLSADQIDTTDRCTHRDAAEFFSHRRENGLTGRMAALIATRK